MLGNQQNSQEYKGKVTGKLLKSKVLNWKFKFLKPPSQSHIS